MITGASRGLGAALAVELANADTRLILWARDEQALSGVRDECNKKGAEVILSSFDLSDIDAITLHFSKFDEIWPVDTVYVNAGLFGGVSQDEVVEDVHDEMAIIDINVRAAIATANIAARRMLERGKGNIILITSLAARYPLADAAGYSASKAAMSAYAAALREKLRPYGIKVMEVQPGHIKTAMTKVQVGSLPLIMSPEKAARIITAGVAKKKAIIAFPTRLSWLITLSKLLPWRIRILFNKDQRFHIKK